MVYGVGSKMEMPADMGPFDSFIGKIVPVVEVYIKYIGGSSITLTEDDLQESSPLHRFGA